MKDYLQVFLIVTVIFVIGQGNDDVILHNTHMRLHHAEGEPVFKFSTTGDDLAVISGIGIEGQFGIYEITDGGLGKNSLKMKVTRPKLEPETDGSRWLANVTIIGKPTNINRYQ